MGRLWLALSAVVLSGCGGALNPALEGNWGGVVTTTLGSSPPVATQAQVVIDVEGGALSVGAMCPGGTGALTLEGSGDVAQWSGAYQCPRVAIECGTVDTTLTSATVQLGANGNLTLEALGHIQGCGGGGQFALRFVGTKR